MSKKQFNLLNYILNYIKKHILPIATFSLNAVVLLYLLQFSFVFLKPQQSLPLIGEISTLISNFTNLTPTETASAFLEIEDLKKISKLMRVEQESLVAQTDSLNTETSVSPDSKSQTFWQKNSAKIILVCGIGLIFLFNKYIGPDYVYPFLPKNKFVPKYKVVDPGAILDATDCVSLPDVSSSTSDIVLQNINGNHDSCMNTDSKIDLVVEETIIIINDKVEGFNDKASIEKYCDGLQEIGSEQKKD